VLIQMSFWGFCVNMYRLFRLENSVAFVVVCLSPARHKVSLSRGRGKVQYM